MGKMIGVKFTLKVPMLGNEAGATGYVFNEYPDFDDPEKSGVQVIFPNGEYDGFSAQEQADYLAYAGYEPRCMDYQFEHVIIVQRDFERGYWPFRTAVQHGG